MTTRLEEAVSFTESHTEITVLTSRVYGLTFHGLWIRSRGNATASQSRLLIYHAGHEPDLLVESELRDLLEDSVARGSDVLLLAMAGFAFNWSAEATVPTCLGDLRLPNSWPGNHNALAFFHDSAHPLRTGAGAMLGGNVALVRNVIDKGGCGDVTMAGLSGGGWATTLLAAMIPEIDHSLSFVGSVPLYFRTQMKNQGDYEQYADPLFRWVSYWELYALATLDAAGRPTRVHRLLYNSNDPCCFDGATALAFQAVYERADTLPGLSIEIVEADRHVMQPRKILDVLDGGTAPE